MVLLCGERGSFLILHRALYGLEQAFREWHIILHTFPLSIAFERFHADKSLYVKRLKGSIILLVMYGDDIKITGDDSGCINEAIDQIPARFASQRVDKSSNFMGLAIDQSSAIIKTNHEPFIN